jgi:hypothetical protein
MFEKLLEKIDSRDTVPVRLNLPIYTRTILSCLAQNYSLLSVLRESFSSSLHHSISTLYLLFRRELSNVDKNKDPHL